MSKGQELQKKWYKKKNRKCIPAALIFLLKSFSVLKPSACPVAIIRMEATNTTIVPQPQQQPQQPRTPQQPRLHEFFILSTLSHRHTIGVLHLIFV